MTREEEIEKASNKYIEGYLKSSNEYPFCDNRKRMSLIQVDLYKMQKAFERGMKEADKILTDKACEWLKHQGEMVGILFQEDFIERFKEAMEK